MTIEECMLALEQMILELPQYRKITNDLCNKHISNYIQNEYEKEEIYIEGNHSSSRNYCWDIYDTIPIEVLEQILDFFKKQSDLKQALNKIKEIITECKILLPHEFDWEEQAENILQIIDKYTKEDD